MTPSDVVRGLEEFLTEADACLARARTLRARASEIEQEADASVEQARAIARRAEEFAVSSLGDAAGSMAFHLARQAFPNFVALDAVPPVAKAHRTDPVETARTPEGRTILHGVEIPQRCRDEAARIVEEARQAAAAGGEVRNPYASDRGKNAWRRFLFDAAAVAPSKAPSDVDSDASCPLPVAATPRPAANGLMRRSSFALPTAPRTHARTNGDDP